MLIENAVWGNPDHSTVACTIDGEAMAVPADPSNRHYAEIMRLVAAGELTIAEPE